MFLAFHPATVLLAWGAFALLIQQAPLSWLGTSAILLLPAAWWRAPVRCGRLLRRARWLFLSVVLLFAFATPGRPLGGGLTAEGLALAAEQGCRLALLLASLAVVHESLGNSGLLAGLHALLVPLAAYRNLRERIVARLMLVLDYVENGPGPGGWRAWLSDPAAGGVERLTLPRQPVRWVDWIIASLLVALIGGAWLL